MKATLEPSIERLLVVARRLAELRAEMIFVGGAVTPLLVTDPAAPEARPTIDVDLVAPVATYAEYHVLGSRLRELGFAEDVDGPTGRWVVDGVRADVMPMRETQMHPTNPWYEPAMRQPLLVTVADVSDLRIVSAPYFVATKLVAFQSRGHGDYYGSHDLEDLMAVIIGRNEIEAEIAASPADLRAYLAEEVARLLAAPAFVEALEGFLAATVSNPISPARLRALRARLDRIVGFPAGDPEGGRWSGARSGAHGRAAALPSAQARRTARRAGGER